MRSQSIRNEIKTEYLSILKQLNQQFMKKIPDGSEAANILVGELDCLKYQITAFVRLTEARSIGDLTEVPLPTRFIFLLLGPPGSQNKNVEMGRSMSTIMVDEVITTQFYKISKLHVFVTVKYTVKLAAFDL